ncbi:MAG TPA: hypothetical protein PK413_00950 [Thermoanaerobaculia bacterium]|nr:hypothetical protein [Thermoanaerobaculia bacterium]
MSKEPGEVRADRRRYASPQLILWGRVDQLTQGSSGRVRDLGTPYRNVE